MQKTAPVSRLERIQVMVLDGNANAAALLRNVFAKLGFSNVHIVNDGYEGIRMMKKTPVHLIFTDWELRVRKHRPIGDQPAPEPTEKDLVPLSGADFVKRLRQSPHSPNPFVPVVMLVNENSNDNAARARDAGVNEIVTKPLDVEKLCGRIMALIDDPRHFITAPTYKGPCRRLAKVPLPAGTAERRKQQIRLVRRREYKGA